MTLFAGIDCGQSSTVAVVGDERANVLGRGTAGPGDEVGQGADSTRLHDALAHALRNAYAAAKLPESSVCAAIVAGISGYDGRVRGKAPQLPAASVRLLHDAPIAHAGAFDRKPGIIVVAGTGSVAYGVNERGDDATVGGWGYLFGDEGSAFWIARSAASQAMHDDDRGVANELAPELLSFFGQNSLRAFARAFNGGDITRAELARFAPHALPASPDLRRSAARALGELAAAAMRALRMNEASVALTGGLSELQAFRAQFESALPAAAPGARAVTPRYEPAVGALLLACANR